MKRSRILLFTFFTVTGLWGCNNSENITIAESSDSGLNQEEELSLSCDRQCLIQLSHAYLQAMLSRNASSLKLSTDVLIVENLERKQLGEGLWQTLQAVPQNFEIIVPDVLQQQVGYLGMVQRLDDDGSLQDVLVAIRLQLEANKILEIEHIITPIRDEFLSRMEAPRPGLLAEVPTASRKSHDELVALGLAYYDALDNNDGSLMPFAEDCQRHENGMITAGPEAGPGPNPDPTRAPVAKLCATQLDSQTFVYIDRIENRRLIAADPVTGLAMGFSHFRHPMDNLPYLVTHTDGSTSERNSENMPYAPFDLPAAHIFKIGADGLVHEIEAMGYMAPYNSPTGWE